MKKTGMLISLLLAGMLCTLSAGFVACKRAEPELPTPTPESSVETAIQSSKFALVNGSTDNTGAYAQAGLAAVEAFATQNNSSFAAYAPETDEAGNQVAAVDKAVADGANVVVCLGFTSSEALHTAIASHPEVPFLVIDNQPTDADGAVSIASNAHCVLFQEEQAGYMAGYALVKEGFRDIAFAGGMDVSSVTRFGYGYLQGIAAAAAELGVTGDIYVTYWYADTFQAGDAVTSEVSHWLETGTQAVFSCGGAIVTSVLAAASGHDGVRVIGVDTDQAALSPIILTSATKDVGGVITNELTALMENRGTWKNNYAGKTETLGAAQDAIGLATAEGSWRFGAYKLDEYNTLLEHVKSGAVAISGDTSTRPDPGIQIRWKNDPL